MMMVATFGRFSGSHLNPTLSLGKYLAEKIDALALLGYLLAQTLGTIAASAANSFLFAGNVGNITQSHQLVFNQNFGETGAVELIFKQMFPCVQIGI